MESIERITPSREPPAPVVRREAGRDDPDDPVSPDDAPELRPVRIVEPEGNIFQARLGYDPDEADVFVEILDPATGDVIRRLPAERAADEPGALRGAILDRMA